MITQTMQLKKYTIDSYGNGWAYEVIDTDTNDSFWVQDQDADALKVATQNFEIADSIAEYMNTLGEPAQGWYK